MFKRFYNKFKENKGALTILYVILAMIGVWIMNGLVIILQMNMILSDTQGQMDVAGVAALRNAVDEVKLRDGELWVDEGYAKSTFFELMRNSNVFDDRQVSNSRMKVTIKRVADGDLSNVGGGGGISSKKRTQYYLVSEAYLQFEATSLFDAMSMSSLSFYNFFDGQYDDISYSGRTEDGKYELVVRSVSRLVYR